MDVTLALGGGGARGLAHIGVLKVLERERIRVRAVAGTSMGGVIAALYAAGHSPDDIACHCSKVSAPSLLRARPEGPGLLGLRNIAAFLHEHLGDRSFEDLRIPAAMTALNLTDGREIVITRGKVSDAVLATVALPGIFPPQILGEHRLVDGGTIDPVPVAAARSLFPAPVVAVVLSPTPERWNLQSPSPLGSLPFLGVVTRLRPGQALAVFMRAMEIAARTMTELRLQTDHPDLVIRPAVVHIGLFDTTAVDQVVDLGEQAAVEALPGLQALARPDRRLMHRLRGWLGR